MTAFAPHRWQLDATEAYERLGGVFIGLDPGAGKTYAFARIAGRCRRPLVLAPASAVAQTQAQFESYGVRTAAAKDGPAPAGAVAFASYQWLTRATQADFFERFAPTDVLMDEFHQVRGLGNSARRRLERYLVANPSVRVGIATGSPYAGGPVGDLCFGLTWALRGHVRDFVPQTRAGVDQLDARLAASEDARTAFRERLQTAAGVWLDVGDVGRYDGQVVLRVLRRDPVLTLPPTWETPSGFLVESAAHAAEVERCLAWGFYHDVDPRPSEAYCEERRTWGACVRRALDQGRADTEYQVRALRPGQYAAWAAAQAAEGPLAEPTPTWVSPHVDLPPLRDDRPTLVWARHRALQDRAARFYDAPLFREGGCARGQDVVDLLGQSYLPNYRGQCAVASIDACYQSLELQHFSHSVVLEPPADPEVWKQLIGRTARQGQKAAAVTIDIVVNCEAAARALRTAVDKAENVRQRTGKGNPLLQLLNKEF